MKSGGIIGVEAGRRYAKSLRLLRVRDLGSPEGN